MNLNWGLIMKHINDNPFEYFQQGGWKFLGGAGGVEVSGTFCPVPSLTHEKTTQSDHSSESDSVSEFEGGSDDFVSSASSNDESNFSEASGSGSGSDFEGGDDSDEGIVFLSFYLLARAHGTHRGRLGRIRTEGSER